jgi:hypothetical protein
MHNLEPRAMRRGTALGVGNTTPGTVLLHENQPVKKKVVEKVAGSAATDFDTWRSRGANQP